jgi:hypothetical protein
MSTLIPNRFLFSLEFPLSYRKNLPKLDGKLGDWTDSDLLPALGEIDDAPEFADVWSCWNENGIAIATRVKNKRRPLRCDPKQYWKGDNLRLCIDTRDARKNKRATRYCHQFFFLPAGGGTTKDKPFAGSGKLQRAKDDAPKVPTGKIQIASHITKSSYSIEAIIPASCMNGFNPADHSRIGFYYLLEDADHGQQHLTIGDELSWNVDPSTWATAVLA